MTVQGIQKSVQLQSISGCSRKKNLICSCASHVQRRSEMSSLIYLWTASVGVLTALNYFQTLACCPSRALGRLCLIQRAAGSNPWDNKSQERQIRVIESSMQWIFTGMESVLW